MRSDTSLIGIGGRGVSARGDGDGLRVSIAAVRKGVVSGADVATAAGGGVLVTGCSVAIGDGKAGVLAGGVTAELVHAAVMVSARSAVDERMITGDARAPLPFQCPSLDMGPPSTALTGIMLTLST